MDKKQIDAAVAWWVAAIKRPRFDNLGPRHPGEDPQERRSNEFASIMAMTMPRPDEEAITRFGEALRQALTAVADQPPYCIAVDYGPDRFLSDVLQQAGIDPSITSLPWKTVMWFEKGGVQVSCGYGAKQEEILLGQPETQR